MKATLRGGLAPFRQCHRRGQMRPVTALAAFHLHEFRDLLAPMTYEIAPHCLALRPDAKSGLTLLGGGHPHRKDRIIDGEAMKKDGGHG